MREEFRFVPLEQIIKSPEKYWAHVPKEGSEIRKQETLPEHTIRCEKYFQQIGKEKCLPFIMEKFRDYYLEGAGEDAVGLFEELWQNVPVFHDAGKINCYYQRDVLKNMETPEDRSFIPVGSHHSEVSALVYLDYYEKKIKNIKTTEDRMKLRTLMFCHAYIISRHHSKLVSFSDFMENYLYGRLGRMYEEFPGERYAVYEGEFGLDEPKREKRYRWIEKRLESQSKKESIWFYLYTKLLYSVLVASDYYAAAEYMSGIEVQEHGSVNEIEEFRKAFEETEVSRKIREYERRSYPKSAEELLESKEINDLRSEIFLEAEQALKSNWEDYIFFLEAPTGSGKSNTSMNLSFRLIEGNPSLKKIYYVYPFNTLVEQNLESLSKVFENKKALMEQVAVINSITPIKRKTHKAEEMEEEERIYEEALLDRQFLNDPVILTTHVSLFDTMFGKTKESAFGFHQLVGSVIVLDEIQSYKNIIWGEIITFLKEMAELLNMKVLIMSATLPNLGLLTDSAEGICYLLKERERYFGHPCFKNRVEVSYELLQKEFSTEILRDHVKTSILKYKKILVEFITKASASDFFHMLQKESLDAEILYMSGDDSIVERKKMLDQIKHMGERPIILVATQVIEAGVDIDMDVGYKNVAKFDSEEQFMGRINRSCRRFGKVYFFLLDDPKRVYGEDIRLNQEFTLRNEELREILRSKEFEKYYGRVLEILKSNYIEITGKEGLEGFFEQAVGRLAFREVQERMRLIDDDKWSMSVYLARRLEIGDGTVIDGKEVWEAYKRLLEDNSMAYARKMVMLSEIRSRMNYFIYQIKKNSDLIYDEQVGDIVYIENGEKYFENNKLNRKKIQGEIGEFVDFI